MNERKRLILWAGDGPLNARDEVVLDIIDKIEFALNEAEKVDTCWLNELIAFVRCLNGVLREPGGGHDTVGRIDGWEQCTLAVFDGLPHVTERERQNDRPFIQSIFADLRELST